MTCYDASNTRTDRPPLQSEHLMADSVALAQDYEPMTALFNIDHPLDESDMDIDLTQLLWDEGEKRCLDTPTPMGESWVFMM